MITANYRDRLMAILLDFDINNNYYTNHPNLYHVYGDL